MNKANSDGLSGIDYTKPLKYSSDRAMEVAEEMLMKPLKGKIPDEVLTVLADMFMAGAYYAIDILTFGQDYLEGDINSVDYSSTGLSDEAQQASKIVQILEETEDEDDGGDDEDEGGGGGIHVIPNRLH